MLSQPSCGSLSQGSSRMPKLVHYQGKGNSAPNQLNYTDAVCMIHRERVVIPTISAQYALGRRLHGNPLGNLASPGTGALRCAPTLGNP